MVNQEIKDLIEEKRNLQESFKNLRLEMKDDVDYESVNSFRERYEALQLKLSCLDAEINIATSIHRESQNLL